MRLPPVEPIVPPNSIDSVSASASEKLERAWPQEPAQRAIGESQPWDQAVAAGLLHAQGAETVAAGPVEREKRPRLTPGGRGARLDVEPRLLRARRVHPVAARMVGRLRNNAAIGRAGDEAFADRYRNQIAVLAGVTGWGARIRGVIAL